jgi:transposase
MLLWDGTGLCIYAKRLERGRFACLWREPPTAAPLRLTMSELQLFLEGRTLVGRTPLSPAPFVVTSMQKNLASRTR